MAITETQLFAFAHIDGSFVPAGRLTLTEEADQVLASSFAYGLRYLKRPGSFSLDPLSLAIDDAEQVRGIEMMPANSLPLFGGSEKGGLTHLLRRQVGLHLELAAVLEQLRQALMNQRLGQVAEQLFDFVFEFAASGAGAGAKDAE